MLGITLLLFLAAHNKAICTNVRNLHIQRHRPQVTAVVSVIACTTVILKLTDWFLLGYNFYSYIISYNGADVAFYWKIEGSGGVDNSL